MVEEGWSRVTHPGSEPGHLHLSQRGVSLLCLLFNKNGGHTFYSSAFGDGQGKLSYLLQGTRAERAFLTLLQHHIADTWYSASSPRLTTVGQVRIYHYQQG